MKIQLSDHFSYQKLIRFTLPSVLMMIFTSVYGFTDGLFVSNFVGKTAFASINLIVPFLQILSGVGAMLGIGGSALTAKALGEGDTHRADRYFSMMIILMVLTSIVCTAAGIAFIRPMACLLGATEAMLKDCVTYGTICLLFMIALHAQYTFQSYLIVAEKPKLGLLATVAAGITNILLDYLFMAVLRLGVTGAALATGLSQCVGGLIPFTWFISKRNTSALHFVKTQLELKPMLKACTNGVSEMLSSISASVTGVLYNRQLLLYAGENGVAAYGVVMYATFVFAGIFIGYSSGCSPVMSYHYGAENHAEMKSILEKSLILLFTVSVFITIPAILFAKQITALFVRYDRSLWEITIKAFIICSLPLLVMWLNIYTSSFFTALNNGLVSGIASFMRTLVFPVICILILSSLWKLDGIWYSIGLSEVLSAFVSISFLTGCKKKYGY